MQALDTILGDNGISTQKPDSAQAKQIKESLFEVVTLPQASPAEGFDAPKGINLYKSTGGACIGQAKDTYGVLQPTDFFEAINEALKLNNYDFDSNKIEYTSRGNGSRISFNVPLTQIDFKNAKGLQDLTQVSALFNTSFDGSTSTTINLFTKRALCSNLVLWRTQKEASFKFKHTPKMNGKALAFSKAIIDSGKGIKKYEELYAKLNKIEIRTEGQINKFLEELLGYEVADVKDLHKKRQAQVEGIRQGWEVERKRTGNTAFGLFNGITYFTNHLQETKANELDHLTMGAGAKLNFSAEKLMVKVAQGAF